MRRTTLCLVLTLLGTVGICKRLSGGPAQRNRVHSRAHRPARRSHHERGHNPSRHRRRFRCAPSGARYGHPSECLGEYRGDDRLSPHRVDRGGNDERRDCRSRDRCRLHFGCGTIDDRNAPAGDDRRVDKATARGGSSSTTSGTTYRPVTNTTEWLTFKEGEGSHFSYSGHFGQHAPGGMEVDWSGEVPAGTRLVQAPLFLTEGAYPHPIWALWVRAKGDTGIPDAVANGPFRAAMVSHIPFIPGNGSFQEPATSALVTFPVSADLATEIAQGGYKRHRRERWTFLSPSRAVSTGKIPIDRSFYR